MINIPFNFQPESVDVKTGSYTIPAGKFAKVIAQCSGGGYFTIDGTIALESTQASVSAVSSANTISATTVILGGASAGRVHEVELRIITGSNFWTIDIGGTTYSNAAAGTYNFKIGSGDSLVLTETIGTDVIDYKLFGYTYDKVNINSKETGEFWVPSGTLLNEGGDTKYTVMLFNEIS